MPMRLSAATHQYMNAQELQMTDEVDTVLMLPPQTTLEAAVPAPAHLPPPSVAPALRPPTAAAPPRNKRPLAPLQQNLSPHDAPLIDLEQPETKRIKTANASTVRNRLAHKAVAAVRQAAHGTATRPYSVVTDCVPDEMTAREMFGVGAAYAGAAKETQRTITWTLDGDLASRWMRAALYNDGGIPNDGDASDGRTTPPQQQYQQHQQPFYVHPVNFDGAIVCTEGRKPEIPHAWAGIESMEAKLERSTNYLVLRFRTYLAGVGDPRAAANGYVSDPNRPPVIYSMSE